MRCEILVAPGNGSVLQTGTNTGSFAIYNYNSGFTLVGNRQRICQSNGIWSGTEPICFCIPPPPNCEPLSDPSNGNVILNGTTVGSVATYTCKSGFALNSNTSIKDLFVRWSLVRVCLNYNALVR